MKTQRPFPAAALALIALMSAACDSSSRAASRALDSEAFQEDAKYTEANLSRCGESQFAYYVSALWKPPKPVLEFKEARFVTFVPEEFQTLSEADRLNGIEWLGRRTFIFKAYRVSENGQWSEWKDRVDFFNEFYIFVDPVIVKKVRGQWSPNSEQLQPVPCDQIPK